MTTEVIIGLWSIRFEERNGKLVGICPQCGTDLNRTTMQFCNEQPYAFCSEKCMDEYIIAFKPEGGY